MSWRKNTARNFEFQHPNTPSWIGPGSYNVSEAKTPRAQASPAFKNKESRVAFKKSRLKTPAPGYYELEKENRQKKPSSALSSRSERHVYDISDNPDPAEYGQLQSWVKIQRSFKNDNVYYDKPYSPNVGQDITGYAVGRDGSVRPKKRKHRGEEWIGPGSYDTRFDDKPKGHSMKVEAARPDIIIDKRGHPGPGAYNVQDKSSARRANSARRISSVKESDKDPSENAPKGGELKHHFWAEKEAPAASSAFKSRTQRNIWGKPSNTPSPAVYQKNESKRPKSSAVAFGKRTPRFQEVENDVPGPGQYNVDNYRWVTEGPSTARKATNKEFDGNGIPGPGTYEAPSVWSKKKRPPSSIFASKVPRYGSDETITPSPAEYMVKIPENNKTVAIHTSRLGKTKNFMMLPSKDTPSPAEHYSPKPFSQKPGISFPHDERFGPPREDIPGPGTYKIEHGSLIKKSYNSDLFGIK